MSALGHNQIYAVQNGMSASPPKADTAHIFSHPRPRCHGAAGPWLCTRNGKPNSDAGYRLTSGLALAEGVAAELQTELVLT